MGEPALAAEAQWSTGSMGPSTRENLIAGLAGQRHLDIGSDGDT